MLKLIILTMMVKIRISFHKSAFRSRSKRQKEDSTLSCFDGGFIIHYFITPPHFSIFYLHGDFHFALRFSKDFYVCPT